MFRILFDMLVKSHDNRPYSEDIEVFFFTNRNARSPPFLLLFDIHYVGWMYGNIAIVSTYLHNIIAFQCTADEHLDVMKWQHMHMA